MKMKETMGKRERKKMGGGGGSDTEAEGRRNYSAHQARQGGRQEWRLETGPKRALN